jgi:hypothetical protein
VLGTDDGTSVDGIITAVVDGIKNTQTVTGAYDPGMITGDGNVYNVDGCKFECGTYGTVNVGNVDKTDDGIVRYLVDGIFVGTDDKAIITNVVSLIETHVIVDGIYVTGIITGVDGN